MELKPNTNGLILNGQIHLLVKTNDEDICTDCSIRDYCAEMTHLPCVMLSDANDEHFQLIPKKGL